ncbi:MAG: L-threonylcarbamoyladenylate synthase [Gammaproteobacteria bacterium]
MTNPQVQQAAEILKQGGVIAYPTEAVYGLGCDPGNEKAIQRILELKGRVAAKGLILIAASFSQLQPYISELEQEVKSEILDSWPGPVTWIVPAKETVSHNLRGTYTTLAIRVTSHPIVQELCNCFGGALVSTSANPAGQEPARTTEEVKRYFEDSLDYILEGETGGLDKPTEIRDALSKKIIRPA